METASPNSPRQIAIEQVALISGFYSTGAAGDGFAPTEELACFRSSGFYSRGAAEDGRAPTEELACFRSSGFYSTGAAEDGRAPTEELACNAIRELLFDGTTM